MIPLKIFFDADTLIAGAASQTGASFLLLQLCEIRILRGLTRRQVVTECRRNLIKKLPQAEPIFGEIVKHAFNTKHYFPVRECNLAVLQPGEMLQKIRMTLSHL